MRGKKIQWLVAAAAIVSVIATLGYVALSRAPSESAGSKSVEIPEDAALPVGLATQRAAAGASGVGPEWPEENIFLEELLAKFGPRINNKHAQIKLIEQLMAYLMDRYPDDWRRRMQSLLAKLFPELAAALFARFEALERLNQWLKENRKALLDAPSNQRRALLWAARHDAFGADAEEIWAGERRSEKLLDTLTALNADNGQSVAQKLDQFLATIQEAYGEQAPRFIQSRQTELLGSFLAVDAVQAELRALPPAQRNASLRNLRQAVGMDDAALTRWTELDRSRDQTWDAGQRYINERAKILAEAAPQQEQRLQRLREQDFGKEEAAIIRSEEEAGFYRYAEPRRIGRE